MPTYEIVRRSDKQHRAGHHTILIDGVDTEYTNDPAQHMPRFLAQLMAAGKIGPDATAEAMHLAEQRSRKVLRRVIRRMESGVLFAGGAPFVKEGFGNRQAVLEAHHVEAPDDDEEPRTRGTEEEAVASFLNRGLLKGLDEGGRLARRKLQDDGVNRDHVADWLERRKALIVRHTEDLKRLQDELTMCQPGRVPKKQKEIKRLQRHIARLHGSGIFNASHGFQYAFGQYLTKQVDLVNDDIRIVPCMTNTSVDTERDAKDQVSDFTTLDEFDGSGYSTGGLALDSQAVNIDDANDRAEFDAADEVVATLAAGTRAIDGLLLISYITSLNASLPLHWLEFAADQTPGGGQFTFVFNAEGIVQASG